MNRGIQASLLACEKHVGRAAYSRTDACVWLPYVVRVVGVARECRNDIHELECLMLQWVFLAGGPVVGVG